MGAQLKTVTSLAMLCAFAVAVSPASAAFVVGSNDILNGSGGVAYLPLNGAGRLGDLGLGTTGEKVTLSGVGHHLSGGMDFVMTFNIGDLDGEFLDPATAEIQLTLNDLDFWPQLMKKKLLLTETLKLTFMQDDGEPPTHVDLLINQSNYGLFRPDGFGPTNNQTVTYTINLARDLGVTAAEFANIAADGEFALFFQLESSLVHGKKGKTKVINSTESIFASFNYVAIPEPATLCLLATGSVLYLKRRRR